jgi:hypothetical protein
MYSGGIFYYLEISGKQGLLTSKQTSSHLNITAHRIYFLPKQITLHSYKAKIYPTEKKI